MGNVVQVETTDGKKGLDLEAASRLKIIVGTIEYDIMPPHIVEMFEAYMTASELHQMNEDHRKHMADLHDGNRKTNEAFRRQMFGE
jgi:hypothetical protein